MSFTHTDESLNYRRLRSFLNEASEYLDAINEMWKLQNLCLHVDFQRRGIGSMLIDWGKVQAEKERVPIRLESAWPT